MELPYILSFKLERVKLKEKCPLLTTKEIKCVDKAIK